MCTAKLLAARIWRKSIMLRWNGFIYFKFLFYLIGKYQTLPRMWIKNRQKSRKRKTWAFRRHVNDFGLNENGKECIGVPI